MKNKFIALALSLIMIIMVVPTFAIADNNDPGVEDPFGPLTTTTTATEATTTTEPVTSESSTTESTTTTTTVATTKVSVSKATGLSVKLVSVNSIKLTWKAVSGATSYKVYRTDGTTAIKYYKTVTKNYLTDKSLKRGKTYKYQVVACKKVDGKTYNSTYSSAVKVTTLAKSMTTVKKSANKTSVVIKYSKVNGASGYEIKYSTKSSLKGAKKKVTKSNKYTIKSLKKNKKYYISVRAYRVINGKKVYTSAKKIAVKTKK